MTNYPPQSQPGHSQPAPRGNLPLGIVSGAVVGAVVVALVWFGLVDNPDRATPAATPTTTQTEEPESPSPSPSPSPTPSPTPSPSPTPTVQVPGITYDLPVGSWVTVLDSLQQSTTTPEQAIARAAEFSFEGHQTAVLDTNAFPGSLNANLWAVVITGATSASNSNDVCRAIGIPVGDHCYPREIKA